MPVGYVKLKDFKGVNLTDPPSEIADDEFAVARNCFGGQRGYVGPRMQQLVLGSRTSLTPQWDEGIASTFVVNFVDKNRTHQLVAMLAYDTEVVGEARSRARFYVLDPGDPNLAGGPLPVEMPNALDLTLAHELGMPKKPTSLVYNNELYLFPGHTVPGFILGTDDMKKSLLAGPKFRELGAQGTGWTTGAGTVGDRFKFGFADVYRGVFVLGGLAPPYESLLAFTQPGNTPDILLSVAKWAGVGFGDGDKLIRVVTTPIVGGSSAVEPYLIAFKQRSVWLVQGATPSSTDAGTLVVTPVQRREGLVSPHAVCTTPYGIAWCSGRNVWLMPPGTQPKSIGDKIKGFLEKLPQAPVDGWFLEFHDDVLYLNFPSSAALVTGIRSDDNDHTTEYLPTQQLWCDLRNPDEPRWWGPQDVRCSHMTTLQIAEGPRQLIGITPYMRRVGGVGGLNAYQMFSMVEKATDSRDLNDAGTLGGFSLGEIVPASTFQVLRTRDMDFGDDSLEKIIEALEVNSTWDIGLDTQVAPVAGTDVPMNVAMLADGGLIAGAAIAPLSPGTQPSATTVGFVLDVDKVASAGRRLSESFIPVVFFPSSTTRLLARTVQLLMQGQQTSTVDPATLATQQNTRRFTIKSITIRLRPIGRRPGGSYGG